jgi:hypothetical protein
MHCVANLTGIHNQDMAAQLKDPALLSEPAGGN